MADEAPRVLIADDDDAGAELTRRLIVREGFGVDRADSLDDALARLRISKPPFDLVLVDLSSGTSQGLKLLEAVRASDDPVVAGVRMVLCTTVDTNRRFSWQSGADGFLVRPFHVEELLDTVRTALGRSDDERQAYREEQIRLSTST